MRFPQPQAFLSDHALFLLFSKWIQLSVHLTVAAVCIRGIDAWALQAFIQKSKLMCVKLSTCALGSVHLDMCVAAMNCRETSCEDLSKPIGWQLSAGQLLDSPWNLLLSQSPDPINSLLAFSHACRIDLKNEIGFLHGDGMDATDDRWQKHSAG